MDQAPDARDIQRRIEDHPVADVAVVTLGRVDEAPVITHRLGRTLELDLRVNDARRPR